MASAATCRETCIRWWQPDSAYNDVSITVSETALRGQHAESEYDACHSWSFRHEMEQRSHSKRGKIHARKPCHGKEATETRDGAPGKDDERLELVLAQRRVNPMDEGIVD